MRCKFAACMYKNINERQHPKEQVPLPPSVTTQYSLSLSQIHSTSSSCFCNSVGSHNSSAISLSMALAKDRTRQGPPACPLDGGGPSIQELRLPSSLELFGYLGDGSTLLRDGESSDSRGSYSSSLLSFHSDPRNSDSCAYNMLGSVISPPQESLSVVASQRSWACFDTSVLSFDGHLNLDHEEECAAWIDAMDRSYQPNHLDIKRGTADSRLIQEKDCFEVGSGNKRRGQDRFGFIYSGAAAFDGLQESIGQTTVLQKRSSTVMCSVRYIIKIT